MLRWTLPCGLLAVVAALPADEPRVPTGAKPELVATFQGPMPTGVTASRSGRVFVNYPRWGDAVEFTVAEAKGGGPVAYPNADINAYARTKSAAGLVSVQSVVVDPDDRLWLLDTGSVEFGPVLPGGAKMVCVDLTTDKVVKTIPFADDVALKTTYLNDVRFDLSRGTAGVAYITDSSTDGPNGIIVVDLGTGQSRRRLHDHPSTKADTNFVPTVEGQPLMERKPGRPAKAMTFGSDGIALSADGKHLYYCPLSSRRLHRVPTDALVDPKLSDSDVGRAVEDLGVRDFASDGLEMDDRGRLYLTDYEHNAVVRRTEAGRYETLAADPRMLWPDTLSVAADGYLYFTANQLHRQKQFHEGRDLRQKPYALFRVKIDAGPVALRRGA